MTCNDCALGETAQHNCCMGQGPKPAKVMVIGEAPGYRRKDRDTPFQGEAGQILREILEELEVDPNELYITNIVKCRPPDNRKPRRSEIAACKKWLKYELQEVQPEYVLMLGASAAHVIYNGGVTLRDIRGKFWKGKRTYFTTFHPGAVLRDETKKPQLKADMRRFFNRVYDKEKFMQLERVLVNNHEDFAAFMDTLKNCQEVAFDIESTMLSPWEGDIVMLGFYMGDRAYNIPLEHKDGWLYGNYDMQKAVVEYIATFLNWRQVICHNGKFDTLWIKAKFGVDIKVAHDTMIMSHLLDENSKHGLKFLAETMLGAEPWDVTTYEKTGGASLQVLGMYNAYDVKYTYMLYRIFHKEMIRDPHLFAFYNYVMMPAVNIFRNIEYNGVYIDKSKLESTEKSLKGELTELKSQLDGYKMNINWNSTQQLAAFLFDELGLTPLDKTKKGANSTSESVLKRLDHPAVKLVLKYREKSKFVGTFIRSWKEKERDSRLHPNFKLHGTVTGRLSCEEPNLQQVPRDPTIRSLVTAPPGYTFIEADFSQVELRIAAMFSNDPIMRELFLTGEDIHTKTASAISPEDLSGKTDFEKKEWRKKAKAINFGFLYGMGPKKFQEYARDKYEINFTLEESVEIRKKFFSTYVGLQPWYGRMERVARINGQVQSPSGRVRHLPSINSTDEFEQSQAVRQAVNSPVQGFASDLTLMSVVSISELLPWIKIVGTVHDSILMEVPDERAEEAVKAVKDIMENPPLAKTLGIKLTLPIKAEVKTGSWGS